MMIMMVIMMMMMMMIILKVSNVDSLSQNNFLFDVINS